MSNARTPRRGGLGIFGALALTLALGVAAGASAAPRKDAPPSNVVKLAPDFTWIGAGGKTYPAKNFRGQPVVILVAPSPDAGALRKMVGRLDELYLGFAAKKTIFVGAFTSRIGRVQSNVPYVIAQNGPAVAAAYGVPGNGLSIIVLGPDGNVDMVSNKVEGGQRVLDIINNTYQTQAAARTGLGG